MSAAIQAGKAVITVGLDNRGVDAGIRQMQGKMRMLSQGVSQVGRSMVGLGTAITAGVGGAFASLAIPLKLAAQIESTTVAFQVLTGSLKTTTKLLGELKTLSARTPMQFDDLTSAAQKLIQFGVSADRVTETIRRLGDASGGDAAKFATLTDAFGKAASDGRLMTQEANRMVDAGFNPLTVIVKATGEQMGDLRKRMSQGRVSFAEFESALVRATSTGGQFYGLLEKQSRTLSGSFSTLKDAIARAITPIGTALAPAVKDLVKTLTQVSQKVQTFFENNQELVRSIAKATLVVGALGVGLVTAGASLLVVNTGIRAGISVMGLFSRATGTLSNAFSGSFARFPSIVGASMTAARQALSSGFDALISTAAGKNAALSAAMVTPPASGIGTGLGTGVGSAAAGAAGGFAGGGAVRGGAAVAGLGGAQAINSAFASTHTALEANMGRLLDTQNKGWTKLVADSQTQVGRLQATIAGLAMSDQAKREISEMVGVTFDGAQGRSKGRLTGRASERAYMPGDNVNRNTVFAFDEGDRAKADRASQSAFNQRAAMEAGQMASPKAESKRLGKSSMPKAERKRLAQEAAGRAPLTIKRAVPRSGIASRVSGALGAISKTPKIDLGFAAATKASSGLAAVLRGLGSVAMKLAAPFAGLLIGGKAIAAVLLSAAGVAAGFATSVLLPIAGLAALGGSLVYLAKRAGVWEQTIGSLTGTLQEFGAWASKLFSGIRDAVSSGDIGGLFRYAFAEAKYAAVAVIEYLVDKVPKVLSGVFDMLKAAFTAVVDVIKSLPGLIYDVLTGAGEGIGTLVGDSLSKGFSGALKDLKTSLRKDADDAFDSIKRPAPAKKEEEAPSTPPSAASSGSTAAPSGPPRDNGPAQARGELITAFGTEAKAQIQSAMIDLATQGKSDAQKELYARQLEISNLMKGAGQELQQALRVASTVEDVSRAMAIFRGHTLAANEALTLASNAASAESMRAFAEELGRVRSEAASLMLSENELRRKELEGLGFGEDGIRILEQADAFLKNAKDVNAQKEEKKRIEEERKGRADQIKEDLKTPLERFREAQEEVAQLQLDGLLTVAEAAQAFAKNIEEANRKAEDSYGRSGFGGVRTGSREAREAIRLALADLPNANALQGGQRLAQHFAGVRNRNLGKPDAHQQALENGHRRRVEQKLDRINDGVRKPKPGVAIP